ncbi:hypothetical protein POJ06DRAFT_28632 [Lipomyces tetrasporus]|uniref:Uncharacterized protein n=1 Tax=Lipomyces tetrasporus TaxID=54092 RepID=A0AAD7QLS8_9ASCO|nr:uncharacterized protein POJ06DRAFT_28632 [Lipomyces tetrasporus]KAJ8097290.1 hypothetical protein POJ06DRAFT_28632 [Lipomyces tetrasporus]
MHPAWFSPLNRMLLLEDRSFKFAGRLRLATWELQGNCKHHLALEKTSSRYSIPLSSSISICSLVLLTSTYYIPHNFPFLITRYNYLALISSMNTKSLHLLLSLSTSSPSLNFRLLNLQSLSFSFFLLASDTSPIIFPCLNLLLLYSILLPAYTSLSLHFYFHFPTCTYYIRLPIHRFLSTSTLNSLDSTYSLLPYLPTCGSTVRTL